MKTTLTAIIGILVFCTIAFSSCNKDKDDDPPKTNHFKVGNTEYELARGVLENWGLWDEDGDVYNLDLTLVSPGIGISDDGYGYMDLSGSGQALYFEMFTTNGNTLDKGDFNFDTIPPSHRHIRLCRLFD